MTARGEFNREQYRIWFFNACTTLAYFDEIRGGILPGSMDRSSLDLMGTRDPMPLIAEMPETLAMLDGILQAQTMEQITRAMTRAGIETINAIPDSEITPARSPRPPRPDARDPDPRGRGRQPGGADALTLRENVAFPTSCAGDPPVRSARPVFRHEHASCAPSGLVQVLGTGSKALCLRGGASPPSAGLPGRRRG